MDYLLKSSVCLAAFYGLYFFGFRRLTFHALNRYYLLASLALSLTIPLLNYERQEIVLLEESPVLETFSSEEKNIQSTDNQIVTSNISTEKTVPFRVDWVQVLKVIYFAGMIIMLFIFLRNIIIIILQITSQPSASLPSTSLGYRLRGAVTERSRGASFFNYIFINPDNLNPHEKALIIAHETCHAQRLHTLDLLLLGILKAVFWFNPIIYFYQKSLKQIHEYEVDALMSAMHDSRDYAHLLLKLGVAPNALIVNQFSTKPLTERIQFLFTKPTKNMKKLLYFLALPILAVGVMAFAEEKVVRVYQERTTGKTIALDEVKPYPLVIDDTRNRATWTSGVSDFDFSPKNISLNRIVAKNYNGFHYYVNPNSLTINMIAEVNRYIGKRSLALVITEKATDTAGNLTKLGLAIKHLRTNQTTQAEVFDMADLREKGKNGAFIFIESYDRNFKESQMSINFGTKNLSITKSSVSHKNLHSLASYSVNSEGFSAINHSSDVISYRVYPGRVNAQTLAEAQAYFAKNGFELKVNSSKNDKKGNLESINLSFGNETKTLIINDLKHLVKLKSERNGKFRREDESIVFEANTQTLETKFFVENWMFKMIEKSKDWEIKGVAMSEVRSLIDSSKFTYEYDFPNSKFSLANIDSLRMSANNQFLVEGKDFIVKTNKIFLDPKYKSSKNRLHIYSSSSSGGNLLYPELTKLNKVTYPDMRFSSKIPILFAENSKKPLPQITKSPSYFSKISRNQDTLRTILEANKLGKNPLVFINDIEYPSSVLYRINPDAVKGSAFYPPNSKVVIEQFGESARDGVYKISTKSNYDFIFKNEKEQKIAMENVRKRLVESKKRVRREIYQWSDGKQYEEISFQSGAEGGGVYGYSMKFPLGQKIIFFLDGVLANEEVINNYEKSFTVSANKDEDLKTKYPQEVKNADVIFNLKTKRD